MLKFNNVILKHSCFTLVKLNFLTEDSVFPNDICWKMPENIERVHILYW